jgi:hypothetical protein
MKKEIERVCLKTAKGKKDKFKGYGFVCDRNDWRGRNDLAQGRLARKCASAKGLLKR